MFGVRDETNIDDCLRKGKQIEIPTECRHNSNVFRELLPYVNRVLPTFSPTDKELQLMSDYVAYVLRPDVIHFNSEYGKIRHSAFSVIYREDGIVAHLRNDPSILHPDWEPFWREVKAPQYKRIHTELFSCFAHFFMNCPSLAKKFDPAFELPVAQTSDVITYILDPFDIDDYDYSLQELADFSERFVQLRKLK